MKQLFCIILIATALGGGSIAGEVKRVPVGELDTQTLQVQGLVINNINLVIEEALMGGIKATVQCTVKNKTENDANYTVYIAAFDKFDNLIACFGLEPGMNIHEAGKVEALNGSGMVDSGSKGKVDHVLVKVVAQK